MNKILFTSLACIAMLGSFKAHAEDSWFSAEYLYWKIQDAKKLFPLVIDGPPGDDAPSLGSPGSTILIGDEKIDSKWRSGGRFSFGFTPSICQMGVEASYFFLGRSSTSKSAFSNGEADSRYLTFPYIDSTTGEETPASFAIPGFFNGDVSLKVSNSMQGAELYGTLPFTCFNGWNVGVFGGFRYLNFNEKLRFNTESLNIDALAIDVYSTSDRFNMDNNFYGGSFGLNALYQCDCLMFNVKAKIGLGAMCQSSKIRGGFVTNEFTDYASVQTFDGGVLALISNSGTKKRTQFSFLPEVELNVGYSVTECLALTLGYNFLYVTNVLRATNQLSNTINPTQSAFYEYTPDPVLVGEPLPKHRLKSSDMWVQGVNVGIVYLF